LGSMSLIALVSLHSAPILVFITSLHKSLAGMSIRLFSHSRQYSISLQLTSFRRIIFLLSIPFFARLSALSFHLSLLWLFTLNHSIRILFVLIRSIIFIIHIAFFLLRILFLFM